MFQILDNGYVTTPVIRVISNFIFEKQKTDHNNRAIPEDKQRHQLWGAIRKDDPNLGAFFTHIYNTCMAEWQHNPNIQQLAMNEWNQLMQGINNGKASVFSWKIKDGDGMGSDGKPYPEHCHGCYMLSFTSSFIPEVFNAQNEPITIQHNQLKAGDYVEVNGNYKGNGTDSNPGIFMNLNRVRVVAFGDAIVTGPSAQQAFGDAPGQLPPGASQTPVAGNSTMPGMNNGQPAGNMPQQQQPAQGMPAVNLPGMNNGQPAGNMPQQQQPAQGMPAVNLPGVNGGQYTGYMDPNQQQPAQGMPAGNLPGVNGGGA